MAEKADGCLRMSEYVLICLRMSDSACLAVGESNLGMLCQVVELSSAAWAALGPLYELEQTMSIDIKRSIWLTVVDKILVDKQ